MVDIENKQYKTNKQKKMD